MWSIVSGSLKVIVSSAGEPQPNVSNVNVLPGQTVGELVISFEGLPERRVPLVAANAVERGGFSVRLRTAATVLLGKLAPVEDAVTPASGNT